MEIQAIQNLRDQILADSSFRSPMDDEFLLRFLYARKFDIDKALGLLKNYLSLRWIYADSYRKFSANDPRIQLVKEQNFCGVLPHKDEKGRAVVVFLFEKWDPNITDIDDFFITAQLTVEVIFNTGPELQKNGLIAIVDAKGLSYGHFKHFTPSNAKKGINLVTSFPLKFKGLHVVHEIAIFRYLFKILLFPLLKKKLQNRIFFHGEDLSSLHQHINPNILPQEFGGQQPPFDNSQEFETFAKYNDKLKEINDKLFQFKCK